MKDQVDSLKANGNVACYINSSQSTEENNFTFKI
jgi:ATP-dependent DNA helicase RecQ